MSDRRYIPRTAEDYGEAFSRLFPQGPAWPRSEETVFQRAIRGIAAIFGDVDARAGSLLDVETDPRLTLELLEDWERAFALPDPCISEPVTVDDRRGALVQRMTLLGSPSRAFFVGVAASAGYAITITECVPFQCGVHGCGHNTDESLAGIGPEEMRFVWFVHVSGARLSWFRAGSGELGVDHHLEIGIASDLECLLRRLSPAHTQLFFDYSGVVSGGDMAGTP